METVMYGIRNCDTIKKARAWLDSKRIAYRFHDFKTDGIDREHLESWVRTVGWEVLLNRAGTTFRKLPDVQKVEMTQVRATKLMLENPSMIKRPVLESGAKLLVGFSPEKYSVLE
jgi:Spx/MgsR family transcriptional regulator